MYLDSRLLAVADLVRQGSRFADIGTDHAYLPAYLLLNNRIEYAVCSDLRVGPLKNAEETIKKYSLENKVNLRISDGLQGYRDGEVNEIAVAGMGGMLIAEFIESTPWLKNKDMHLILQPMTHSEDTRKALYNNGFFIDKEVVVKDKNKLYVVISAFYNGEFKAITTANALIGELHKNTDNNSKEYLKSLLKKYTIKLEALKKTNKDFSDIEIIVKELTKCLQ